MSRSLFALCIMLFASSAMANNVASGSEQAENGVKPGKTSAVGSAQDSGATSAVQPTTPARSSTPRVSPARWHSLLPGMIR